MQKFRFLPIGIMAGLVLLALLGSCNTDQRAKGFEEYIIAQTDSVALTNFKADPNYEGWLRPYRENPKDIKRWIEHCKEVDKQMQARNGCRSHSSSNNKPIIITIIHT